MLRSIIKALRFVISALLIASLLIGCASHLLMRHYGIPITDKFLDSEAVTALISGMWFYFEAVWFSVGE